MRTSLRMRIGLLLLVGTAVMVVPRTTSAQTGPAGIIYESSFGTMTFSGGGVALTGTYGETGVIEGVLEGLEFTGQWGDVSGSFFCGDEAGPLNTFFWGEAQFTFSSDFSSFSGSWGRCEGGLQGDWNGTAVGGTPETTSTTTTTTTPATTTTVTSDPVAEIDNCAIRGRVLDVDGVPVPDVLVELHYRGAITEFTRTDDVGLFSFSEVGTQTPNLGFDSNLDPVSVRFVLSGSSGLYEVAFRISGVGVVEYRDVFLSQLPGCRADLDSRALPATVQPVSGPADPADIAYLLRTFRYVGRAKQVSDAMGIQWDTVLRVVTFCNADTVGIEGPCTATAQWSGPFYLGDPRPDPRILIKPSATKYALDQPMNLEYHEVGHHVLMEGFSNQLPATWTGSFKNHGGLYLNATSNDAFVEGFAEFFSTQVRRQVDGIERWWMYPVGSSRLNLEYDYMAWDVEGRYEEFALAGVLVDFVDSDADYSRRFMRPTASNLEWFFDPSGDAAIGGEFLAAYDHPENQSSLVDGRLDVELKDGRVITTMLDPPFLVPGFSGLAEFRLPSDVTSKDQIVNVTVRSGHGADDDAIGVSLEDLWDAISTIPVPTDDLYPHPRTVEEVYAALSAAFGGDSDGNGFSDVDDIFINHGFFNDTAGGQSNQTHDDGEAVGSSGYLDRAVDGVSRSDEVRGVPGLLPIQEATFEVVGTSGVGTPYAFVEVLYPGDAEHLSHAYKAYPDDEGIVGVTIPPAASGATVRVSARAIDPSALSPGIEDYAVIPLATIDAAEFWAENEGRIDERVLALEGDLSDAVRPSGLDTTVPLAGSDTTDSGGASVTVFLGVVAGMLALGFGFQRLSDRRQSNR